MADYLNSRVQEFSASGSYIRSIGGFGTKLGQVNEPYGLTADSSGNIWVADTFNNRIEEFTNNGIVIQSFGNAGSGNGEFKHPSGIAIDPSGNIWISDYLNHRIVELAPVPEPTTAALLLFGMLGCGGRRRRRTSHNRA